MYLFVVADKVNSELEITQTGKSFSLPNIFGLFLIFLVELRRGFDLPYPLLWLFREQIYRLARYAALLRMSPTGYTVGGRATEEEKA